MSDSENELPQENTSEIQNESSVMHPVFRVLRTAAPNLHPLAPNNQTKAQLKNESPELYQFRGHFAENQSEMTGFLLYKYMFGVF